MFRRARCRHGEVCGLLRIQIATLDCAGKQSRDRGGGWPFRSGAVSNPPVGDTSIPGWHDDPVTEVVSCYKHTEFRSATTTSVAGAGLLAALPLKTVPTVATNATRAAPPRLRLWLGDARAVAAAEARL